MYGNNLKLWKISKETGRPNQSASGPKGPNSSIHKAKRETRSARRSAAETAISRDIIWHWAGTFVRVAYCNSCGTSRINVLTKQNLSVLSTPEEKKRILHTPIPQTLDGPFWFRFVVRVACNYFFRRCFVSSRFCASKKRDSEFSRWHYESFLGCIEADLHD